MNFSEKDLQKVMSNSLFAGSDREQVKKILMESGSGIMTFSAGEVILSPQSDQKYAAILLSGKAVVNTPDPTKKMLLRFLGVGEPFGIANLFTDEPFVSVIRAHGECRVFFIYETAIRALLENDSAFLYRYLKFLSGRICFLNAKIGYLTAGSPERRLALYLYSLGKKEFHLPVSISALSDLLNVGRASLYRAFDRLNEDGFLQKKGRSFLLPNPDAMLKSYQ